MSDVHILDRVEGASGTAQQVGRLAEYDRATAAVSSRRRLRAVSPHSLPQSKGVAHSARVMSDRCHVFPDTFDLNSTVIDALRVAVEKGKVRDLHYATLFF